MLPSEHTHRDYQTRHCQDRRRPHPNDIPSTAPPLKIGNQARIPSIFIGSRPYREAFDGYADPSTVVHTRRTAPGVHGLRQRIRILCAVLGAVCLEHHIAKSSFFDVLVPLAVQDIGVIRAGVEVVCVGHGQA